MKFDILETNVTLKAKNHMIKPTNMTIGGFTIFLDGIEVVYDHFESSGGWEYNIDKNGEEIPICEWISYKGTDIFSENGETVDIPEEYSLKRLREVPEISKIGEIHYEAFTNIDEGVEYEFYPTHFELELYDVESRISYTIEASKEVLNEYINNKLL